MTCEWKCDKLWFGGNPCLNACAKERVASYEPKADEDE